MYNQYINTPFINFRLCMCYRTCHTYLLNKMAQAQLHLFFLPQGYHKFFKTSIYFSMAITKADIELASINAPPGILPPDTTFESQIGHNVINISNYELNEHQDTALEKGLTFCLTPKGADKSEIWNDFKEFHRRLELTQFFALIVLENVSEPEKQLSTLKY